MVIVVTDEVGDDEERLEDAIAAAQKAKVPVYVLGSQAIFGRNEGYVNYIDPKTKHVFHGVPVRQGPESVDARADPAAVLVRRSAVRDRRGRLRAVCPQPAGQRHRRDLLRHPVRHPPHGVRPGPDAGVQARLDPARPVREADRTLAAAAGGPQRRADHPAEAARHALRCTFRRPTPPSSRR